MPTKTRPIGKDLRLSIRATAPEKAMLTRAANARNMNTSQFVLQASLDVAQRIIAAETEFKLSPEEWETFCARLDEPAKIVSSLRRLFDEKEPYGA